MNPQFNVNLAQMDRAVGSWRFDGPLDLGTAEIIAKRLKIIWIVDLTWFSQTDGADGRQAGG